MFQKPGFFFFLSGVHISWVEMDIKIWACVQGKMGQKYQQNAKWLKTTFEGPILVPGVFFGVMGASLY